MSEGCVASNKTLSLRERVPAETSTTIPSTDTATQAPSVATSLARRRRRRQWTIVFVACLAVAALVAAWRFIHVASPVHFLTAPVTRGDVTRAVTASGTVNPQTTIQVGTYV